MAAIFYKWFLISGWWLMLSVPGVHAKETPAAHPFYVAVTEINLNPSDHTLEVSCKMFADDLEQMIEKDNHAELDISTEKDKASFDKFIPAYINNHLRLAIDGKPSRLSYIGFEKDKESAYCYFQVEHVNSLKKLDVINSILHDFTADQINIMHVVVNGKRQSTKLDYPNTKASFSF